MDPNVRRLGIGGSDVAAIFGVDEFRDAFDLWAVKKGGLTVEQPPSIRMIVGKCLEEGVLKLYEHFTGRRVEYCDVSMQHPERPWMIYTPDALVVGERRGVDAKVVAWDQRRGWDDGVPPRVELQCCWYMAALDYEAWDVCALMGEGEPRIYSIYRDLELEAAMLARVEEWYDRFIVGDDRPPIGGNETAAQWLKQMYPKHKRDIREATAEEIAMLTEYVGVRVQQAALSRRQDVLETYLKDAIKEHEGLIWSEGRFTWKKTKDSEKVDWKSLALLLLTRFVPEAEQDALSREYLRTKPGVRRIYCSHDDLREARKAKPEDEEVLA